MAATHHLIDAQFDRAVEIVQSLPRTGPIQTDYEEKLQMYRWVLDFSHDSQSCVDHWNSLYKQGNPLLQRSNAKEFHLV